MVSRLIIDAHGFGHTTHEDQFGDIIHAYGTVDPTTGRLINGKMQNLSAEFDTSEDTSGQHFKAAPLNGPVEITSTS
jgi:hypothetical protein